MKIGKAQLKEMVRRVVRKKLLEMDLEERDAVSIEGDKNGRMSRDELSKHLEAEKEKAQQKRTQQKRQAMKQTTRGMELECGPGNREVEGEEVLDDEEEEYLSRLERLILQSEKERQI